MDSPGNVSVTNSPREKSPGQMTTGPNASERQPSPNKPTPGGGRPRPPRPTKPPIAQKPAVPVKPSCISPPKPSPNVVPKRTPPPLPSTPPRGNVRMSPRAGLSPKVSPKPNTAAAAAAAKLNKSAEDLTESRTTNSLNDKPHEKDTSEEKRTKNFNNNDITKKSAASDSDQNVNVDTKASLAISLPNKNEKDKLVDTQIKALTDNHIGPTKISDNLEQCVSRDVCVNSIEATRSEQVTGKSAICFTPPSTPTSPLKSPRSPDHIYSEISEVRTPNKQSPCKPTAGAEPDKHEKASKSISDRERLNAKDLSASILEERSNDRTLPRRPVPKSRRSIVSNRRSTDGDSDFSSDSSYLMEMMTPSRDDVPDNQVTSPTSTDVSVSESTIVSPSTSFESSVTDNSKSSPSKSLMESISSQLKSVDNSSSVLSTESPKQSKKQASKKEAAATTPDNTCDMLKEIEDLLNKKFAEVSVSDEPEKEDVSQQPDEAEPSQTDCAKEVVGRRHTMGPDHFSSTPLRPPRPKRAASKIKQQLQMDSGSGGSTESLDSTAGAGGSGTLKRKCPPKPKRTTLPRVGRTQSDVTGMKNYMDEFANRPPPPPLPVRSVFPDVPPPLPPRNKTMTPINHAHPSDTADPGVSKTNGQAELIKSALEAHKTPNEGNIFVDKAKPKPVRKAPPPPERPPLESRLRSHQAKQARAEERKSLQSTESAKPRKISNQESKGFLVSDSQQDPLTAGTEGDDEREADQQEESKEDIVLHNVSTGSSDHDYHEIPDSLVRDKPPSPRIKKERSLSPILSAASKTEIPPPPPPQLPPRTYMETNSPALSSEKEGKAEGKDTQCQSSESGGSVESTKVDAVSGSGDDDQSRPGYLDMSGSSTPPSDKSRPISNASQQSSCNSENGSSENVQNEDLSSASDSENEDDEILNEKRKKKAFMIAKEIMTSEMVFVDVLQLLNVDFRVTMSKAAETADKPVVPNEVLNKILDYLPQLQNFNEDLLRDLNERVQKWNEYEKVADIFVKKGPFLKMYSSYIKNFENATANLDEACKKYPAFATAVRQFESTPRCASLALKHYMLKPIQRIPQYKLLLQDYLKHLTEECGDYQNTINALAIVSKVADHANQSMRQGDEVQKLMEIQHSLIGSFEVILPGRVLLKSGELMKLSRKELQPRMFFLFNDVLLYTVPSASGYKLNNILPLPGMRVSKPVSEDFKNEFNILSIQRSFTVAASTPEERDDWMTTLSEAIEDLVQKRNTFEPNKAAPQTSLLDKDFVVGHKAPLMVPDARVTMCMLCLAEFTITWRRHHCRACGRVVCGNCSENKAPLRYLKYKPARVCEECYLKIEKEINESSDVDRLSNEGDVSAPTTPISLTSIKARFQKIRKSARSNKGVIKRPAVLKEVRANDEGSDMSGYLKCYKNKKWKKMWYVLKDKVLYTYKASEDMAAVESLPLLGYEVLRETMMFEGIEPDLVFQLSHSNTQPHVFRTDSAAATTKWINVMRAASVA